MFPRSGDLKSGIDDTIGLHGGDGDIEAPEEDKDCRGDGLDGLGAAQLSANSRMSPGHEDEDGEAGLNTEHGHGEAQASGGDIEGQSLRLPVDGGDGPCDTDTKEDIDSIGASDVANRVVSGIILNSSGLRGEGIRYASSKGNETDGVDTILEVNEAAQVASDISDHGSDNSDGGNRNDEGGVSVGNALISINNKLSLIYSHYTHEYLENVLCPLLSHLSSVLGAQLIVISCIVSFGKDDDFYKCQNKLFFYRAALTNS